MVILPPHFNVNTASREIFPCIDSRLALENGELTPVSAGVFEWNPKNPQMLLVYSIRWNMPKDTKKEIHAGSSTNSPKD
ncbi:MAG: hypothetical protein N2484_12870 [Clostridia bacterium]|nr:hypothetical protein [Clostridia bacterium]